MHVDISCEPAPSPTGTLSRAQFFGGIFLVGCANGLTPRLIESVTQKGLTESLLSTFQISLIVWFACYVGLKFIFTQPSQIINRYDLCVGICCLVLTALPVKGLNWFGITVLASYVLLFTRPPSLGRRGAIILLATTASMLWSRLIFAFLANPILRLDAALTAWFKGTEQVGNMVRFADGHGYLVILPGCSSFANISLAFLTWVVVNQAVGHQWRWRDLGWLLATCFSVVLINVGRLSLMASDLTTYLAIHNEWGEAIANLITVILIVAIAGFGARRELKQYV